MPAHHWQLDPVPASAAKARSLLRGLNLDHHTCKRGELLVTELVANALRHADLDEGDRIEVAVREGPGALHVEVVDPGRGFEPDALPGEQPDGGPSEGGWGLRLLERLSDEWGVARKGDRT
ncbi:MAG TPA: ATP-binding protein, partial [Baekduia sp.]|nr:ATP-binding protein [Baekduia sp.]